ncbi:MAG TPA: hypothetical protein VHX61_03340 [Rhizomicrobium sp.]|jgi:hypothetical protein|nr:hypothetical protein [Rhizomicrobium sp.]
MKLKGILVAVAALVLCPASLAQQPYVYEVPYVTGTCPGPALNCNNLSGTPNIYNIYIDGIF